MRADRHPIIAAPMNAAGSRPAVLGGDPLFPEPIHITRALLPDRAVFDRHLERIFSSAWFTNNGPVVRELEVAMRDWLEVEFCLAFGTGTIALEAALRSLDLAGEVITTPFTFPATVHAIAWNGLTPVFADVDPETYNLDVESARRLVSERTSAIVPVHVFGNPCDVEGFEQLARKRGLRLIYDAAHAFGVRVKGRPIGHWGDLSILSFHATKVFHTAEGGAVIGGDGSQRERLTLLRNFGIVSEDEVSGIGVNGKLSELHAALGLAVISAARDELSERRDRMVQYRMRLEKLPGVRLQRLAGETHHNGMYAPVEICPEEFGLSRDQVHAALLRENVVARKYFWPLCSENSSYSRLPSARPELLPNAHRLASRILCLPSHSGLGREGAERICDRLANLHANAPRVRRVLA